MGKKRYENVILLTSTNHMLSLLFQFFLSLPFLMPKTAEKTKTDKREKEARWQRDAGNCTVIRRGWKYKGKSNEVAEDKHHW